MPGVEDFDDSPGVLGSWTPLQTFHCRNALLRLSGHKHEGLVALAGTKANDLSLDIRGLPTRGQDSHTTGQHCRSRDVTHSPRESTHPSDGAGCVLHGDAGREALHDVLQVLVDRHSTRSTWCEPVITCY